MRTWGRQYAEDGSYTWTEVSTDSNGNNDAVYLTALIQTINLNLGESPFYANSGIPAYQSVATQVFPDFYATQLQSQYANCFASLKVQRKSGYLDPTTHAPAPFYDVSIVTHSGVTISQQVPE